VFFPGSLQNSQIDSAINTILFLEQCSFRDRTHLSANTIDLMKFQALDIFEMLPKPVMVPELFAIWTANVGKS
jgi:hypothetical protein